MKEIKLSQGKFALVDDEDFEYLNQWKWTATSSKIRDVYAIRSEGGRKNRKYYLMHRVIMKTPAGLLVDHKDHNGLNNQKSNLRNCTKQQNQMNIIHFKTSTNYRGVTIEKRKGVKYIFATIKHNGKKKHIGTFKSLVEAAKAYDKVALELRGEYANLNFK